MKMFILPFSEITKADFQEAGGKAASLGELTHKGFNVPPGFSVTSDCLPYIIEFNKLEPQIDGIVASFDFSSTQLIEKKTSLIRDLIINAVIPDDMLHDAKEAIASLNQSGPVFVAVRSSVAVRGTDISSFPGMMDTYHYLKGEEEIIRNIRNCWASLWTTRAVFSRHRKKIDHARAVIAPLVQRMVHSEVAGVMFTANPVTNSRDEIVIEANFGLGETVVCGKYANDFYTIAKAYGTVKEKRIGKKTAAVVFDEGRGYGRTEAELSPERMESATLMERQLNELADVGAKIEEAFGFPQDIEWAYEKGELFILQSRRIRTLKE
jgi:pyruvate, water dikinase